MGRRGTVGALLCLALTMSGALGVSTTATAADPPPTRVSHGRPVVLHGVVAHYAAILHTGGERQFTALRTRHATYRLLAAAGVRIPRPGTEVTVRGRIDGDRLTALAVRVTDPGSSARPVGRSTPSSTRILAMRVYWGSSAPDAPTEATWKQSTITGPDAWFGEVSGGRYSVSGTTTPWLKIKKPSQCGDYPTLMRRAKDAAKAKGYSLGRYGRFVVYVPCDLGFLDGLADMPGSEVWLWKTTSLEVEVHEQGHNLGLDHAMSRSCKKDGHLVTWSAKCRIDEYGDPSDAMGNARAAHYNAYNKKRLGWLQGSATLTSTDTRTLTPAETVGGGLKGLRVKVSAKKSYWLELRTGTGADAGLPPLLQGVQVRYQKGRRTQLLDMMPGSGEGFDDSGHYFYELDRATLPEGSSWTSPEGVRITVVSESPTQAEVKVRFGASAPSAPSAPAPVTATPAPNGVDVSWTPPEDNGATVTKYVVSASPGTVTKTVNAFSETPTGTRLTGLTGGQQYTISVRAVNEVGTSPAAQATVTPTSPSVTITAPAQNATFTEGDQVTFSYDLYPVGGDWDEVALEEENSGEVDWSSNPGDELTWDSSWEGPGTHRLRVVAYDHSGDTYASAWRTITLN